MIGMYVVPLIAVFLTEIVFGGWEFDRSGLFLILSFDYILANGNIIFDFEKLKI
jgi:hypothetical protein